MVDSVLVISFSTLCWIPLGPMDLNTSSVTNHVALHCFPGWCMRYLGAGFACEHWGKKGMKCFSLFCIGHHEVVFPHLSMDKYLLQTFVLKFLWNLFLLPNTSLPIFSFIWALAFLILSLSARTMLLHPPLLLVLISTSCVLFFFLHFSSLRGSVLRQMWLFTEIPSIYVQQDSFYLNSQ